MILLQTKALFVDAYRDLNARKMFWWVIGFSVVTLLIFSAVGVSDDRLSVLVWNVPSPPMFINALAAYKSAFTILVIQLYMGLAATVLALISTAGIFPDLIASGSIDLYLSKPISRARLFLTKYVTGLMFVALQITLVATGSFLIMGLRAGYWNAGIFMAIPIVLVFFSYLYSICVLIGVSTRSGMTALFLTLVAWLLITGLNNLETYGTASVELYAAQAKRAELHLAFLDNRIKTVQGHIDEARDAATRAAGGPRSVPGDDKDVVLLSRLHEDRVQTQKLADQKEPPEGIQDIRGALFWVNTVVPKTGETLGLLSRFVLTEEESARPPSDDAENDRQARQAKQAWESEKMKFLRSRSAWWVIGSSLGFEAVIVAISCWLFCRRDY